LGQDVADFYGAAKYFPPVRTEAGDSAPADPRFPAYTEIENMRSYPDVLAEGEEVVILEKIHGTNDRVGFVTNIVEGGRRQQLMGGSRGLRRKEPPDLESARLNTYWYPLTLAGVENLLRALFMQGHNQAVLYGEVFGSGIQSLTYGQKSIAFCAFDLIAGPSGGGHGTLADPFAQRGLPLIALGRAATGWPAVAGIVAAPQHQRQQGDAPTPHAFSHDHHGRTIGATAATRLA
jgi:hypothetical protein